MVLSRETWRQCERRPGEEPVKARESGGRGDACRVLTPFPLVLCWLESAGRKKRVVDKDGLALWVPLGWSRLPSELCLPQACISRTSSQFPWARNRARHKHTSSFIFL